MLLMINIFVENIDVADEANKNNFQQWLSFKFEVPTLWSNVFNYSNLWI